MEKKERWRGSGIFIRKFNDPKDLEKHNQHF